MAYEYNRVSKLIDHSLLNPTLTKTQIDAGIDLALAYDVASICILPSYHKYCVERVAGTTVMPSSTVGFPHGGNLTKTKLYEAERLIDEGCMELDMVANISAVLSGDFALVEDEIKKIVDLAHQAGRKVKVIFENCYLKDQHKIQLCKICCAANADWVKTSTGYGMPSGDIPAGATIPDLQLMLDNVTKPVQVKAAGGVRDYETLIKVMEMGVTRVGASRTAEMLNPARTAAGLPPVKVGAVGAASY
jgi:deoxyribose-phosphate aldolase